LLAALISAARAAGYGRMRLETVTFMKDAIELYARFGFRHCPPYYAALESFRDLSVFMELELTGGTGSLESPSLESDDRGAA
jgi:ribosomal protein S18 acetylase RimI-like enzyme